MDVETVQTEAPETIEAPVMSVKEHAAEFRPDGKPSPDAPEGETSDEKTERLQKRDKDTGQFAEGHKRVRPSKDINVRLGKAHAEVASATERATAAETRLAALEAEVTRLRADRAPAAEIAKAEAKVESVSTSTDPEPTEDDPKYGGDYAKYLRDVAAWNGREAYRSERKAEREQAEKQTQAAQQRETLTTWAGRVKAASAKYPDYDAVAFAPTRIADGSPVDQFIMEDENGPEVLYHLQKHAEELDEILRMTVPSQIFKRLTLLSQHFSSSSRGAAGTTGAVATRTVSQPPKPPTPVRTEAQRTTEPPPLDGSLGVMGHRKAFPIRP